FSTLNVEIDQGCVYETAGKIGIFPENDEENVREVAAIQGYDLELTFQFVATSKKHPFPTPITIREALVKYCDLTSLVRKKTMNPESITHHMRRGRSQYSFNCFLQFHIVFSFYK
ncbi:MAG: hypothetical protein KA821_15030, partial [Chitinophagaceae bacterium]|nr:hypothetical protein [Chitinophagaceae bacterium]